MEYESHAPEYFTSILLKGVSIYLFVSFPWSAWQFVSKSYTMQWSYGFTILTYFSYLKSHLHPTDFNLDFGGLHGSAKYIKWDLILKSLNLYLTGQKFCLSGIGTKSYGLSRRRKVKILNF